MDKFPGKKHYVTLKRLLTVMHRFLKTNSTEHTWDVEVNRNDAVTASDDGVRVVVVAATVGTTPH